MKTKFISQQPLDDGRATFEYQLSLLSPARFDWVNVYKHDEGQQTPISGSPRDDKRLDPRLDQRAERQLRRMANALAKQSAEVGQVTELEGEAPMLTTTFDSSVTSHWKILRRVIRKSRSDGYASEAVDGTLLYAAFFDPDGNHLPTITSSSLPADIVNSGILQTRMPERNSLVINAIPPEEQRAARLFLPYYLYPIPKRAISELIRGQLTIFVIANPAGIMAALEKDGFEVSTRPDCTKQSPGDLVVSSEVTDDEGNRYHVEMHNLSFHINEVIYECKSVEYVVEVARSMRAASIAGITSSLRSGQSGGRS